jgi:hydroxymethylbilane synthase
MLGNLRQDLIAQNPPLIVDDGGGGFITGRFDSKYKHEGVVQRSLIVRQMLMLMPTIGYEDHMNMESKATIILGSRGSPLALVQSRMVQAALSAAHPEVTVDLEIITTTGDRVQDRPLSEIGGKGLFTKEIEAAMLGGRIDLAVHSAKDMETQLPDRLGLIATLQREDPRDVFLSEKSSSFADLPKGAVVGTTSLRRRAQILHRFPNLRTVPIRGNVDTRLTKMRNGEVDATLLALAGLKRLGRSEQCMAVLEPEFMLPAAAQGAIGIEARRDDDRIIGLLGAINHQPTFEVISAERALLATLDGSCQTPVGALAEKSSDGRIRLRGLIADPDGAWLHCVEREGLVAEAITMGRDAGVELRGLAGEGFFSD